MKQKHYYTYLMINHTNTTIYTGVTDDLVRRVYEHKNKITKGFTDRYNVNKLVYFEQCDDVLSAIAREKQIKAGSRQKKIDLIVKDNPKYEDLYPNII